MRRRPRVQRANRSQFQMGSRQISVCAAGVTAKQVQALWIKEVIPGAEGFPNKAKELANNSRAARGPRQIPERPGSVHLQPHLPRLDGVRRQSLFFNVGAATGTAAWMQRRFPR